MTTTCRAAIVIITVGLWLAPVPSAAQCPTPDCDPALLARRTLTAVRLRGVAPVIDGRLDEPVWAGAALATEFSQSRPRPAAPATLRSEARVLVDEQALYIALRYFDPEPAKILAPLARRDDETTSDWAFVEIDSRHDRRTGFSFGVNPRGLQVDGLWLDDVAYDTSWNGVWESAAHIDEQGWTAEYRIPFSQLAFNLPPDAVELTWGINFYRYNPSRGESSNWSPRYSSLGGVVSRFNDLRVPAPSRVRRLEMTPYVAPRAGNDEPGRRSSVKAGADVKVGLGSSFSLTATVLPDFGQVEADPSQVNLTAFELFQTERRPFFLEGLDVFRLDTSLPFSTRGLSFAEESPFYSRRIGRAPHGDLPPGAILESIPGTTTLLGAAKLSGQTSRGWTLGVFTAMTDVESASVRRADGTLTDWPVEARTAVSVARALKSFDQGDSLFGLFAADLHRSGLGPELAGQDVRDAAALGTELRHRFGGRQYEVRGWALATRLTGEASAITRVVESPHHYFQRPDAERLHDAPYGTTLDGIAGEVRLSRVGGALHWDLTGRAVSPGFDMNEIGFQRNSDWLLLAGTWRYERFRPDHPVRAWAVGSSQLGQGWTWAGEPRARIVDAYASIDTRNYWTVKLTTTRELQALSTDWLRGGPAVLLPPRTGAVLSLITDQRKASYVTLDASASREPASGSSAMSISPLLNIRSSDILQWSVGSTYRVDTIGWQYVGRVGGAAAPEYIVGRVRQETVSLTLRADLTLSPRLALQLYAQPFGSTGRYDRFQHLVAPRDPVPAHRFAPFAIDGRLPAPDAQERSLNGSLALRWEYRPGSFLTAVWNHQRDAASSLVTRSPGSTLMDLFGDPPTNVVLLKTSFRLGW